MAEEKVEVSQETKSAVAEGDKIREQLLSQSDKKSIDETGQPVLGEVTKPDEKASVTSIAKPKEADNKALESERKSLLKQQTTEQTRKDKLIAKNEK